MAERRKKLDEDDIAAIVSAEIDNAISYDTTERNADRIKAMEYYRGEMRDLPHEEGRSSVVDHTVQDVIGWILPGLMRVFFSSDQLYVYEPQTEREDKEGLAQQATDYVNQIVLKECPAYQVHWDVFHDALLHGNGIFKHWWDHTPVTKTQMLSCLSEDQMTMVTSPEGVEVLEHTEREPQLVETPEGPMPVVYHDLKIKVETAKGKLFISAVAPENFLINKDATDAESARFYGERLLKTRSELIEMGIKRSEVEDLSSEPSIEFDDVTRARLNESGITASPASWATEEIEIFETYPLADVDGDGIAERLKVLSTGPSGNKILDWEIWDDEGPYSDLTPERVPHRWKGRSVFDDTEDMQRVKTALMRQMLDNLYNSNIPDRAVDMNRIDNPDSLFDRRIGQIIRVKGDPGTAIANLEIPFTAQHSFTALEYTDRIIERRTGVSQASMGLDPEVLQNQTATAANIQQSAQYSKIELIARNFAEGMKRTGRAILKLIVKHQDRPRTIRLRNEWVEMDPRAWNSDMDVSVNVGLGSGSRERDLGFLSLILQQQKEVMMLAGGPSTQYGKKMAKAVHHSMQKTAEGAGLKSPDAYFPEISDEELAEIAQASANSNPEAAKAKAQMELEQMKAGNEKQLKEAELQGQGQLKKLELQAQAELDQRKMMQSGEIERLQAEADVVVKDREMSAKIALADREFEHKALLEKQRLENEWRLALLEHELRMKEADYKGQQAIIAAKQKPNGADKGARA